MNTRTLLEKLGFQERWNSMTDQQPAYIYDFGNFQLDAGQFINRHFKSVFLFTGVYRDARTLALIEFEMPLEIESFEQGVAWITYGIGTHFQPSIHTPWLTNGRIWRDHLPWRRDMGAYGRRLQCSVEKDWFRIATKKLHAVAAAASERDIVWLAFDGEALRIAGCGTTVIIPTKGTAWDARYAIKATQLDHLLSACAIQF